LLYLKKIKLYCQNKKNYASTCVLFYL